MPVQQANAMTIEQFVHVVTALIAKAGTVDDCPDKASLERVQTLIAFMHMLAGASDDELKALESDTGGDLDGIFHVRHQAQSESGRIHMLETETGFEPEARELVAVLAEHDFDKDQKIPECCAEIINSIMGES